ERRVGEYKLKYIAAFAQQLLAVLGADSGFIAAAEQSSQLGFTRREGLPRLIYALAEVFRKKRQRERASALLDEFLCILISRAGFQRGFEVFEREVLAVKVIIRVGHAVVLAVVAGEVLGVRLEQFYRLFKQLAVAGFGAVIVRAGELAVKLWRAFVLRQSLDS